MPQQIPFNLAPTPDLTFETFEVGESNRAAAASVMAWPEWASPIYLVIGPHGTGKTHLGTAWAKQCGAEMLDAPKHLDGFDVESVDCVFVDNADNADENSLFTLMNHALNGRLAGLLLTARSHPKGWSIHLPDLRSRLVNTPASALTDHDDDILEPIIRKLFEDQGRDVKMDVVRFLMMNHNRSVDAMRSVIKDLDFSAQQNKKDITRAFVASYFKTNLERDLFSVPSDE